MIEAWAEKLALRIKDANQQDTVSVGIMKYALIIVINFAIPFVSAVTIGIATGKAAETLLCFLALVLLRTVSGGYHFESSTLCMIMTTAMVAAPPHLAVPELWIPYMTAGSLIVFGILAPANIKGHTRISETYFPMMKIASLLLVSTNFLLLSPSLTILIAVQALTLLIPNKGGENR